MSSLNVSVMFLPQAHVQYLSSVIKNGKQRMRQKYGVQYILDNIRTYYRSTEHYLHVYICMSEKIHYFI